MTDDQLPTLAQQQQRLEALRRERGEAHPDTLAAMLDLAEMLWARRRVSTTWHCSQ
jgi:hypothetical protein